jgi:hypothetical protein
MTVAYETRIKRFIGLSTDTKPTAALGDVPDGSYFWCYDTNILWKTYDGTNWVTHTVKSITQPSVETMSFHQAAADYPLFTCAGGAVLIENFTLTNTINLVAEPAGFDGTSVQTDHATPIILVAAAGAVHAQLSAGKVFTYSTPFVLFVAQHINYSVIGATTDADPAGFTVSCRYQPIHPAGYLT